MSVRFYLVPAVTTDGMRVPKYLDLVASVRWQGMDFGHEPCFLFAAEVDTAQHAAMVANADVTAVPADIDNTIGGARQAVEDALESFNIPGDWVTSGMTYRFAMRAIIGCLMLAQRFAVVHGSELFTGGVNLNTEASQLPADYRVHLRQCMDTLGYDRSTIVASSTMRFILKTIGQQAPTVTFLGVAV